LLDCAERDLLPNEYKILVDLYAVAVRDLRVVSGRLSLPAFQRMFGG
jgi:hypothetical protein